jgi:hypothetical protein
MIVQFMVQVQPLPHLATLLQHTSAGVYDDRASATAGTFSNSEIYIPNYTSSNQKSFSSDSVTENNATSAIAILSARIIRKHFRNYFN